MGEVSLPAAPLVITPPASVPAAGTIANPVGVGSVTPVVATAAVAAAVASTAFALAIPAAATATAALAAPTATAPTATAAAATAALAAAVAGTASCGGVITSGGASCGGGKDGPSVLDLTEGGPVGCYLATTRPAGYHRDPPTAAPARAAAPMPARAVPTAPRNGKAASDGNYQLLYAREVHDDAL